MNAIIRRPLSVKDDPNVPDYTDVVSITDFQVSSIKDSCGAPVRGRIAHRTIGDLMRGQGITIDNARRAVHRAWRNDAITVHATRASPLVALGDFQRTVTSIACK